MAYALEHSPIIFGSRPLWPEALATHTHTHTHIHTHAGVGRFGFTHGVRGAQCTPQCLRYAATPSRVSVLAGQVGPSITIVTIMTSKFNDDLYLMICTADLYDRSFSQ